jgi:tetratricopeptide (TPR) repeat protein
LWALHRTVFGYSFLSDDFLLLHLAKTGNWTDLFAVPVEIDNFYRPLSRAGYFRLVGLLGEEPWIFRSLNIAVLLATLGMIVAVGKRLGGMTAGILAAAVYALFYPHRITLGWISCSQDLLAGALGTAAILSFLCGRRWLPAVVYLLALYCKESVAPLPLFLGLWIIYDDSRTVTGTHKRKKARARSLGERLRRAWMETRHLWAAAVVWAVTVAVARLASGNLLDEPIPLAGVRLAPEALWTGLVGSFRALLYLEQPWMDLLLVLRQSPELWIALVLVITVAILAFAAGSPAGESTKRPTASGSARKQMIFGALWLCVFLIPPSLVGHIHSAYYMSFAAIGFALVLGGLLARLRVIYAAPALAVLVVLNLWANLVEFSWTVEERPRASIVHSALLERGARFMNALHRKLLERPPRPGEQIYLGHIPNRVTYAMSADRFLWVWFDDPSLSHSYFSLYVPERQGRPFRVIRFAQRESEFVDLPASLVEAIVAGEEAAKEGRLEEARRSLSLALDLADPEVHDLEIAEIQNTLAVMHWKAGEVAAAIEAFQQALSFDPGHAGALSNLTEALASLGDFDAAREHNRAFLEHHPGDPYGLFQKVRLELAVGETASAQTTWQELVAAHPQVADSLSRLGLFP